MQFKKLKAFPMMHELHSKSFRIQAGAEINHTLAGLLELRLNFKLEAAHPKEMAKINFPNKTSSPERKSELWKATCFECFIPSAYTEGYLEFNGSPSGDWNLYSFKKYRDGMNEFKLNEDAKPKQIVITQGETQVESEWSLPLIGIQQGFQSIGENHHQFSQLGFSAVLSTSLATLYWAISHDGIKPDFHLRSSFSYPLQERES